MKTSLVRLQKQVQRGFTLVEIAIVLVIIGLLIGGILRGQELINTARVRSLVAQQTSMQTAYYGFLDRYRMIPGNITTTQAALVSPNTLAASVANPTAGTVTLDDSVTFFNNITQAGFINCSQCATGTNSLNTAKVSLPSNSPTNIFGAALAFESVPDQKGSTSESTTTYFLATSANELAKPLLVTGSSIPTNMLAEMDRKMDDGIPNTGNFRFTNITGGALPATAPTTGTCIATASGVTTWQVSPVANCQGASEF
jgi:prepilin-type N-terminal cleavage/methylation domain-containing protein